MWHLVGAALTAVLLFGAPARGDDGQKLGIHVAYPQGMNGQIAVAMQEARLAGRHGLDARFTAFQNGPPAMEALASGSVDAVLTSFMPVTAFLAKLPGEIKVVALLGSSSYSLLVGAHSGIDAAGSLAGKKVGVSFGSDSHLDLLTWLEPQGLAGRAQLVNIAPADLVTALANKSVDAIVSREPQASKLTESGSARALRSWPHRYVSVMRTRYLEEHPEAAGRFVAALRESILYIAGNKERTSEWFGKQLRVEPSLIRRLTEQNPTYQVSSLEDVAVDVTPQGRQMLVDWFEAAFAHGLVKRKVEPASAFLTP